MKLLCFVAILLLELTLAQNQKSQSKLSSKPNPAAFEHDATPLTSSTEGSELQINEEYLEQVDEAALQHEIKGKLNEWVIQQLEASTKTREFNFGQSFIIHLLPEQQFEYRWRLMHPDSKKRDYLLFLNIYTYQQGTDITLNRDPAKQSYVQVETKSKIHQSYSQIGKLYISKAFSITFPQQSKLIRITNRNQYPVLVEINMEVQAERITSTAGIATNQHFALSAEKLKTIYEQFKNTDKSRSRMYKWEWGFLQREQRYDNQMLKLTGFELLAILATAIVQMYCIKSLLENKQII